MGCIIGTCPVCNEFIYEDEDWDVSQLAQLGKEMVLHSKCIALSERDPEAIAIIIERERLHQEILSDKECQIAFLAEQNRLLKERLSFFAPRLIENTERKEE